MIDGEPRGCIVSGCGLELAGREETEVGDGEDLSALKGNI